MPDPHFLDLQAGATIHQFSVRITPGHCVGSIGQQFLFGGMGMAFAVRAFETCFASSVKWATIQYLAPTPPGALLELDVNQGYGRRTTQATLRGRIGGQEVMAAAAALGGRPAGASGQWQSMPAAPDPALCAPVHAHADAGSDLHALFEIRLAKGRLGIFSKAPPSDDGHVLAWIRPLVHTLDAEMLAIMADFVPSITSNALGMRAGGNSLDNTLRIIRVVPTQWVLCDIFIGAMHDGIGHGRMDLYAQDGTLLAMASQSFIVRVYVRPNTVLEAPFSGRPDKAGY